MQVDNTEVVMHYISQQSIYFGLFCFLTKFSLISSQNKIKTCKMEKQCTYTSHIEHSLSAFSRNKSVTNLSLLSKYKNKHYAHCVKYFIK